MNLLLEKDTFIAMVDERNKIITEYLKNLSLAIVTSKQHEDHVRSTLEKLNAELEKTKALNLSFEEGVKEKKKNIEELDVVYKTRYKFIQEEFDEMDRKKMRLEQTIRDLAEEKKMQNKQNIEMRSYLNGLRKEIKKERNVI